MSTVPIFTPVEISGPAKPIDKSGTRRPRKSISVDGNFVAHLRALGYFARIDGRASSVVYAPITLPLSPNSSKPKPWRDTCEEIRGLFYHAAIKALPNVRSFTLRLSEPVEADARAQGAHCLAWLHRRVARHLRRALDPSQAHSVAFWFAIEETAWSADKNAKSNGALHLHGEIAFNPSCEKSVRKALKGAGGDWGKHGRGHAQLVLKLDPDFRWAGYSLKNTSKARPNRRRYMAKIGSPKRWVAQFDGKAVTANEALKRAAIDLHAEAVAEVLSVWH